MAGSSEGAKDLPPCPACGSHTTIPIVYGLIYDAWDAVNRGELELGGCVVYPDRPLHRCRTCQYAW